MPRFVKTSLICGALALPGCASAPPPITASIAAPASAAGAYTLSAAELALSCKDLTGRMQLRILDIRDYDESGQTSSASRTLQSGFAAIFGGSDAGTDPNARHQHDRARLEAYNQQLRTLNCPSFDLDAELQPKDVKATPLPTVPATGLGGAARRN
jgi:hypothetical protein